MILKIRDLREDHDLKQNEIASLLNCSQVCYSRYETGERAIPLECLVTLAEFYDTSVDYLLGLTDEPQPYPRRKKK